MDLKQRVTAMHNLANYINSDVYIELTDNCGVMCNAVVKMDAVEPFSAIHFDSRGKNHYNKVTNGDQGVFSFVGSRSGIKLIKDIKSEKIIYDNPLIKENYNAIGLDIAPLTPLDPKEYSYFVKVVNDIRIKSFGQENAPSYR